METARPADLLISILPSVCILWLMLLLLLLFYPLLEPTFFYGEVCRWFRKMVQPKINMMNKDDFFLFHVSLSIISLPWFLHYFFIEQLDKLSCDYMYNKYDINVIFSLFTEVIHRLVTRSMGTRCILHKRSILSWAYII